MKWVLRVVIFCVAYDIVVFEYHRLNGGDTMFSSFTLPIAIFIILYTFLVSYLARGNSLLGKSITLGCILQTPIYGYILVHLVAVVVLIVTGISSVFQGL